MYDLELFVGLFGAIYMVMDNESSNVNAVKVFFKGNEKGIVINRLVYLLV
jgi:hypothetical protein